MDLRLSFAVLTLAALTLVSCAKAPTSRFYVLAAVSSPPSEVWPAHLTVAIGPIELPEYLDRPQLVSRVSNNRLQIHEFDRWGGPLAEETARVVADQLSLLLGGAKTYSYPSQVAPDTDYRIVLQIRHFDGVLGKQVALDVIWSILDERRGETLLTRQQRYLASMNEIGAETYVEALGVTLEKLSADLANALKAVDKPRASR